MKKTVLTFVYGLLILIGGIAGFTNAGSLASLFMGLAFSLLLFISAIGQYKKSVLALFSAILLTAILAGVFSWRFVATHYSLRNAILALVSFFVLGLLIFLPNAKKGE